MTDVPKIPEEEYTKPLSTSKREPLPLLPDREWLNATIQTVTYQIAMFNNAVQYVCDQDKNPILDKDGNQIPKKEFEIVFELSDYQLPDGSKPRLAWLRMGASIGEKAHLPVFLNNVLGSSNNIKTPQDIIKALTNKPVQLQLRNKTAKDGKIWQNVIFDAVKNNEHAPVEEKAKVEWEA